MNKSTFKLIYLIHIFLILNCTFLHSQISNQNLNINFLGSKSGISFNYERTFNFNEFILFGAQTGVGINCDFAISGCRNKYLTIPSQVSAMVGKKNVYLEIGAKGSSIFAKSNYIFHLNPFIGIRLHPAKKNSLITRIYYSTSGLETANDLDIWTSKLGISLGVSF